MNRTEPQKTPHEILDELLDSEEALKPVSPSNHSTQQTMSVSQDSQLNSKNASKSDHQN